jgi:hypothetical protein
VKVLVACEESQVVCSAFRARGHEAYSCDILPTRGAHPEWHIQDNVLEHLDCLRRHELQSGGCVFGEWDLMIAHPPCTYLANSGVSHLYNKDKTINKERWVKMQEAAWFFNKLLYAKWIHRIVIENPIHHKYAREEIGVGPGQIIQPYQFGHMEQKATCLWLKNVPALKETNNVKEAMMKLPDNQRQRLHYLPPSEDRQRIRSITFQGIAEAMAEQWGKQEQHP